MTVSPLTLEYELSEHSLRVGKHVLHLTTLKSLEGTIDQVFDALSKVGKPELLETLCPYFGMIWPAALGLVHALVQREGYLANRSVLELGCGLAIPSFAAATQGAQRVVATDFHPDVPQFLKRNLAANSFIQQGCGIEYHHLDWRSGAPELGQFDLVVGSDILYEREQPERVAQAFVTHLKSNGRGWLADPGRPYLQDFVTLMEKRGFATRTHAVQTPEKEVFLIELSY